MLFATELHVVRFLRLRGSQVHVSREMYSVQSQGELAQHRDGGCSAIARAVDRRRGSGCCASAPEAVEQAVRVEIGERS